MRSICIATIVLCSVLSHLHAEESLFTNESALRTAIHDLTSPSSEVRATAVETLSALELPVWDVQVFTDYAEVVNAKAAFREVVKPFLIDLIAALAQDDVEVVATSAALLAALGTDGQEAVPFLAKRFRDETLPDEAKWSLLFTLMYVSPKDRPVLATYVQKLDFLSQEQKLEFDRMSRELKDARILKPDKDPLQMSEDQIDLQGISLTSFIAAKLFLSADRTLTEVPFLAETAAAKDRPLAIRVLAIALLGHFEWDAQAAIPTLRKLLRDQEPVIRHVAALTIFTIDSKAVAIEDVLAELQLTDEETAEFQRLVNEMIDEERKEIEDSREYGAVFVPELIEMVEGNHGYYQRYAIVNLGKIGTNAKAAIAVLRKASNDPCEATRKRAVEALQKIEGNESENRN